MSFFLIQFLNGLASASSLFLVACGLSIIFGVTRIVNFAHGSFYMLGAYLAVSLTVWLGGTTSILGFWSGILLAAAAVGVIGALVEILLLRRIYRAPELFPLLATFGVVLIVGQLVIIVWGPQDLIGPRAPGLAGAIDLLGHRYPTYELLLIVLGPLVLGALHLLFHRTHWGILVRAATHDREMVGALGVNQAWLFTSVFALGAFLAALGGALQLPREAVSHDMDLRIIADAFVVVVVGGMGSVAGAFLAALLIGELSAFGIWVFPQITLVLTFLIMAVVLVVRPWGLLGRPELAARVAHGLEPVLRPASTRARFAAGAVVLALILLPAVVGTYGQFLLIEIFCLALFATSLHFIMGPGGMVSFGHAAYFGLGAYGAGLAVKHLAVPMSAALAIAPATALAGALLFGWFCVRLSGVYLAMLSLAFAQITYAIVFQWYDFTGGDNGLVGIWPAPWASRTIVYYYLALALNLCALLLLRRFVFAPFGMTLRACRDAPLRADAIGIDIRTHQWLAFAIAGAFAGLSGGILAFLKGTIDPTWLAIPQSIEGLVMVLLGGVQTLTGPIVGAAAYHGLEIEFSTITRYWPLVLGAIIVVLVLAFPQGIVGFVQARLGASCRAATLMAVLEVEGLRKAYGGVQAVAGVGFALEAGELLALIGPNGAGKTTCFNCLNGQIRPDAGSIRLAGRELVGLPPRRIWRHGVGRTFQVTQTFGSMTVLENVQQALLSHHRRSRALWPRAGRLYRDEALALLARVDTVGQAERACGVLAYGDLKRVELAVALAHEPRLLLMDEPTAGMAPGARVALMALTRSIVRERGLAVLFTEHDMDVVFANADRIMVMNRGRLIADGTPAAVRGDPLVQEIYLGAGRIGAASVAATRDA